MRYAKRPTLVQPSSGPEDNRQLFFSGGPPGVSRKDVLTLFSYYGKVLLWAGRGEAGRGGAGWGWGWGRGGEGGGARGGGGGR